MSEKFGGYKPEIKKPQEDLDVWDRDEILNRGRQLLEDMKKKEEKEESD